MTLRTEFENILNNAPSCTSRHKNRFYYWCWF